jgi:UDP:flavonoid glycosyltransferase YjiC (YdhE family)
MGITQRALAAKVPVCVVPWGRDQLEVARRAAECGAGVMLSKGKLSAATLKAGVAEARRCKPGAERIAAAFAAAGGAERMAVLLEELRGTAATPLSRAG